MAIEQKHLDQAIALAKIYGATRLILFGSALSHPDQAHDLDLACECSANLLLPSSCRLLFQPVVMMQAAKDGMRRQAMSLWHRVSTMVQAGEPHRLKSPTS